jgi:arylsulfatase
MEDFKLHILSGSRGGLPNMELYNVMRDPGEKFGEMFSQLWAVVPFQRLIGSHMGMIKEYPHRELPSGTF